MLYKDSLVARHKNNYKLLRKIHYQEKKRNLLKLNLLNDEYDDWRSEITKFFTKWVTEGYCNQSKQLYLYEENNTEVKAFIKQLMGNYSVNLKKVN